MLYIVKCPRANVRSVIFGIATLLVVVVVFSSLVAVTTVHAQKACFNRTALLKHLSGKFEEAPIAAGLAANGDVLEVFSSPDGITWTIMLTKPSGVTCVMASGESWVGII